jgi:hypothetical protein
LNNKSEYSSDIKIDLVEQEIPKLSYFDPSDAHDLQPPGVQWVLSLLQLKLAYACDIFTPRVQPQ